MLPKVKVRKYTYYDDRKNQQKQGRKLCCRSHTKLLLKNMIDVIIFQGIF